MPTSTPFYAPQPDKEFKKVMDYKGTQIEKAQRSTQESIRVSGSATDATLIITTLYPELANWSNTGKNFHSKETKEDAIKEKWEHWRKYFFEQRDIDKTYKSLSEPFE